MSLLTLRLRRNSPREAVAWCVFLVVPGQLTITCLSSVYRTTTNFNLLVPVAARVLLQIGPDCVTEHWRRETAPILSALLNTPGEDSNQLPDNFSFISYACPHPSIMDVRLLPYYVFQSSPVRSGLYQQYVCIQNRGLTAVSGLAMLLCYLCLSYLNLCLSSMLALFLIIIALSAN